jgi:hypothetical protein
MADHATDHAPAVAAVLAAQVGKPAELVTGTINWAAYIVRAAVGALDAGAHQHAAPAEDEVTHG